MASRAARTAAKEQYWREVMEGGGGAAAACGNGARSDRFPNRPFIAGVGRCRSGTCRSSGSSRSTGNLGTSVPDGDDPGRDRIAKQPAAVSAVSPDPGHDSSPPPLLG